MTTVPKETRQAAPEHRTMLRRIADVFDFEGRRQQKWGAHVFATAKAFMDAEFPGYKKAYELPSKQNGNLIVTIGENLSEEQFKEIHDTLYYDFNKIMRGYGMYWTMTHRAENGGLRAIYAGAEAKAR